MTALSDLLAARFGGAHGIEPGAPVDAALARILGRRTIRRYSADSVPEPLRRSLLACAQSAPSKSDLQQYSIIEIADPALKSRLAELADTPALENSPVVLVFCADMRRIERINQLRGHPFTHNNLNGFMNAVVDAALAMQAYALAAEAAGLGCCFISQVRKRLAETCAALGLPDGVFPVAGLTAGWPGEDRDVLPRLPPSVVVHRDRYDDSNLAVEIDAYDQRRHAIRPIPEKAQARPDVFGTAAFYGWSENQARRQSLPDELGGLGAYVAGHGFDLG
jgi:nitroreductase/FMN reductase [NAD(P)H]